MTQIHQAVTRLITDAYYRAKRATRTKFKNHARPMTVRDLRALPYAEYLKSAHWQQLRIDTLKRAGFACRDCGAGGALQVHHKTYKRLGCEKPRDLRVLCASCHKKAHGKD